MPTTHKQRRKTSVKHVSIIAIVALALIGVVGWRISSSASSEDWQFYVSVHYGDPDLSNDDTKTMVVDGQTSDGRWGAFRFTSLCDFSGTAADVEQFMTVMAEQPDVLHVERPEPDVLIVQLNAPIGGNALTDFSNFMLEGAVHTGLNNCGETA